MVLVWSWCTLWWLLCLLVQSSATLASFFCYVLAAETSTSLAPAMLASFLCYILAACCCYCYGCNSYLQLKCYIAAASSCFLLVAAATRFLLACCCYCCYCFCCYLKLLLLQLLLPEPAANFPLSCFLLILLWVPAALFCEIAAATKIAVISSLRLLSLDAIINNKFHKIEWLVTKKIH